MRYFKNWSDVGIMPTSYKASFLNQKSKKAILDKTVVTFLKREENNLGISAFFESSLNANKVKIGWGADGDKIA